MISRRFSTIAVSVLLSFFAFISVQSALRESLTFDEIVHIEEGYNAWQKHEFLIDTNNPPLIRELAVLPLLAGFQKYMDSSQPNFQAFPARAVIILLGLLLGGAVYLTGAIMFSREAGIAALFFYVLDPNMLANSHYVTQDTGAALFYFLGYMSLLWVMKVKTWQAFIVHGVCMGCMAVTKITTIPYYILADILIVPYILRTHVFTWFPEKWMQIFASISIFFLVIWSAYFFRMNVIVAPGDARGRVSARLRAIGEARNNGLLLGMLDFLEVQPVPLGDYIAVVKNTLVRSSKPSDGFFMGKPYTSMKWYFMPVTALLKTPAILLIFSLFGLFTSSYVKKDRKKIAALVVPAGAVLVVATLSGMQPFVRYILPMYPFMCILAGYGISRVKRMPLRILVYMALIWNSVYVMSFFPHFISFTGELAGPRTDQYRHFIDSNYDWGQSLPDLKKYIDSEKPSKVYLSYFGRDDAGRYGISGDFPFGSYKFNEICAFHEIEVPSETRNEMRVISISNYYLCGYNLDPAYQHKNIREQVGQSFLVY